MAVAGPTASGKTDLAINLASRLSGEIISCDSMQLYRGMDIGTAKATEEEKQGIKHHLVDVFDISESFSVSDYAMLATSCADEILARGKTPVFCGGTGFYLDAVIKGLDFGEYENIPGLREELTEIAQSEQGAIQLHRELEEIDPASAAEIHPSNVKRLVRAIEIYRSSGITPSEQKRRSVLKGANYDSLVIGLRFSDRQTLYDRINLRVDRMIADGLVQEAATLFEKGLLDTPTAGAAIGYKELYPYFCKEASLEECVEVLKRETRRYAKRQMTWFKRNADIFWIDVDTMSKQEVMETAYDKAREFLN